MNSNFTLTPIKPRAKPNFCAQTRVRARYTLCVGCNVPKYQRTRQKSEDRETGTAERCVAGRLDTEEVFKTRGISYLVVCKDYNFAQA